VKCAVCLENESVEAIFCAACARSWDRDAKRDLTIWAAVRWAARRARRFERMRKERTQAAVARRGGGR